MKTLMRYLLVLLALSFPLWLSAEEIKPLTRPDAYKIFEVAGVTNVQIGLIVQGIGKDNSGATIVADCMATVSAVQSGERTRVIDQTFLYDHELGWVIRDRRETNRIVVYSVYGLQVAQDTTKMQACGDNLFKIDEAKSNWVTKNGNVSTGSPKQHDLVEFLGGTFPKCPEGGTYIIGNIGGRVSCSRPDHPKNVSAELLKEKPGRLEHGELEHSK